MTPGEYGNHPTLADDVLQPWDLIEGWGECGPLVGRIYFAQGRRPVLHVHLSGGKQATLALPWAGWQGRRVLKAPTLAQQNEARALAVKARERAKAKK